MKVLQERLTRQATEFPRDPTGVPRSGAAGGFAGGMWAHFGAELVSGADAVLDAVGFDRKLEQATAVVVASDAAAIRQAGADIAVVVNPRSGSGRLPGAGMLQS